MKIYTRTGDAGSTGLFGGPRTAKDDVRIEAYGTVDELNAALGVAGAYICDKGISAQLFRIQNELFNIGAELATPDPDRMGTRAILQPAIDRLESEIDATEGELPPLKHFILPAGSLAATHLHMARAICRRAERRVVTLSHTADPAISMEIVIYLNRLSDLLFVLSRQANQMDAVEEVRWVPNPPVNQANGKHAVE